MGYFYLLTAHSNPRLLFQIWIRKFITRLFRLYIIQVIALMMAVLMHVHYVEDYTILGSETPKISLDSSRAEFMWETAQGSAWKRLQYIARSTIKCWGVSKHSRSTLIHIHRRPSTMYEHAFKTLFCSNFFCENCFLFQHNFPEFEGLKASWNEQNGTW